MGAMENKGLNILNSSCVLANPKTATDKDFINIEAIIGHEYFHNWTGNRVTCRDWFQLSLKEGLTVFRDQEFTADLHNRSIKRIADVNVLRSLQFAEDCGPMSHPVRPESYIEMNNFYTLTVYEKGAEVIRMMHRFLGEAGFQKGLKLYFQRHDGYAVTIDEFVASMSAANAFDFSQFMLWYSEAGTPKISIKSDYDAKKQRLSVEVAQHSTHVFLLPLDYALLNPSGEIMKQGSLKIKRAKQTFVFEGIDENPTPSWLRDFSAPVKLSTDLTFTQKIFLVAHESDGYAIWDNAQQIWLSLILTPNAKNEALFFSALENLIKNTQDYSLLSEVLTLPSERFLHQQVKIIDVFDIHQRREQMILRVLTHFREIFLTLFQSLKTHDAYTLTAQDVGARALKNVCLAYLSKGEDLALAYQQFESANCMTDNIAAFAAIMDNEKGDKTQVKRSFFEDFKDDTQVMDKFFAVQAASIITDVGVVKKLMEHKLFCFNTPNRLRSVVGSFTQNYVNFHHQAGYEFFTDIILKLNHSNPQIGARLVAVYNHWRRFTPELKALQKQQLEKIIHSENLSNDIFEITQAALK
jgi:aminopeptidase N